MAMRISHMHSYFGGKGGSSISPPGDPLNPPSGVLLPLFPFATTCPRTRSFMAAASGSSEMSVTRVLGTDLRIRGCSFRYVLYKEVNRQALMGRYRRSSMLWYWGLRMAQQESAQMC